MIVNRIEAKRNEPLRQTKELPKDVLLMIFDHLSEADLARSRRVCRRWNVVGRDERLTRKFQHAFGARCWYRYFGQVGVDPQLPGNIGAILNGPCPFWPEKKVHETHLLVLIPEKVNGKPFTLDYLGELIQKPKQGHATKYRDYFEELKKQYGNQSVSRGYWALITRDVLPWSRGRRYRDQQSLVRGQRGYEVPKLIEAATCVLMEYVKAGKYLYGSVPLTYTRCQEQTSSCQGLVGFFSSAGLCFRSDNFGTVSGNSRGVGAVQRLL